MTSAQNPEESQSPAPAPADPIGNRPADGARQISAAEAFGPNGLLQEAGGDFLGLAHEVPGEITPESVPAPVEPPPLTVAPSKHRSRVETNVATLEPQPPPMPSARVRRPAWVSFAVVGICVAALGVVALPYLGSKGDKDAREAAQRTASSAKQTPTKTPAKTEPVAAQPKPVAPAAAPAVVAPAPVAVAAHSAPAPSAYPDLPPVVEPTPAVPVVQVVVEPVSAATPVCVDEAPVVPTTSLVAASTPAEVPAEVRAPVVAAATPIAPVVPVAAPVVEPLPEPEPVATAEIEPVAEPIVEPVVEPVFEPVAAAPTASNAVGTAPSNPPVAPATNGPALEGVVMLWNSNEIPFEHIRGVARMQTPNVGDVRLTTSDGENFSGRLVSVGQGKVWLNVDPLGKLAFDIVRVKELAKPTIGDGSELDKGALAVGGYAKARTDGGTLFGKVTALDASHVTLMIDGGARVTVERARVEAAKAPAAKDETAGKVKVKKLDNRPKPAPRPAPKPAPKPQPKR
ncbi:MAG: hypothetical protein EPO68_08490 [Planctomycetota bacterium]|nr:MAG: hypothetical protein EPO68_08490 [Planctomycetota bacterium]